MRSSIELGWPPTSSALDFLTAPERLIDAIDSPAMRWFLQVFEGSGKEAFGLVGRGATVLLRGLGKITGIEFLEQVAEFVGGINELFGGFKDRLPLTGCDVCAVDGEGEIAHLVKSLS